VVDALSKRPAACSLMEISTEWKSHLLVEYSKDNFTCDILDGQVQDDRYRVIDDIIFYKDRVYLVLGSDLGENILTTVHDSPLASHQGQREVLLEGPQTGRSERGSLGRASNRMRCDISMSA
jgi:hypothetical protein